MKKRTFAVFMVLCLGCVTFAAAQQIAPPPEAGKSKLGYGFAPGLVSGRDYVAGQLIVGFKAGVGLHATVDVLRVASASQGRMAKEIAGQALLLEFPSEQAVLRAVKQLIALPEVAFVERNGFMSIPPQPTLPPALGHESSNQNKQDLQPQGVSTDRGTGLQWHLPVIRKTAALPALSSNPPTVAVIDTGVDYTHPDLGNKVIKGRNVVGDNLDPFDDHGHGTHVAGILAARAGNGIYGEGVCPNCKIFAVKVLRADNFGSFFDVADGMQYVVANRNTTTPPIKIVNMSLGGPFSNLIANQVLAIKNAGMILVASAGNSNTTSTTNAFPGADPNTAFRVMATEENDARAFFSNFSPSTTPNQFNIAAPGFGVYSTLPGEGFGKFSGTSMASPMVAGAAALVWGQFPGLTRNQVISKVIASGALIKQGFTGPTRRVDVRKAITASSETAVVGRVLDPFTGLSPSPNTSPVTIKLFDGATSVASDPTNRSGFYEMTGLAPGSRSLRANRVGNPTVNLRSTTIITNTVTGPFTDAYPSGRSPGNASIIMDWLTTQPSIDTPGCIDTCNGWDFDLHVRLPDNSLVSFANRGDLAGPPFVILPRNSNDDLEPVETIVIGSPAANGSYKVFGANLRGGTIYYNPSWAGSGASVQVFNGVKTIANFSKPPGNCSSNRFWHVGNLTKTGTAYTWTTVNTCSNIAP